MFNWFLKFEPFVLVSFL